MLEAEARKSDLSGFPFVEDNPLIVAAIPAFNERRTIAKVVLQAQKLVDRVMVCDDGSTDLTAEIAEKLGALVIRHEKNMGYGSALRTLFEKARELNVDIMVILDADGQHDPREIPKLLGPIKKVEADVVIGSRFIDEQRQQTTSAYRKLGIKIITALTKRICGTNISDATSGFRAYSRKAIQLINITEQGMGATTEIIIRAMERRLKIIEKPVIVTYKGLDSSTYNPFRLGLDIIAGTVRVASVKRPFLFFKVLGIVTLTLGIILGVWTMNTYVVTRQLIANVALISLGSITTGLLLTRRRQQ